MTYNEQSPEESEGAGSVTPKWGAFVSMGVSSAVIVALGVVLGILADGAFHTSPLFLFVGVVLGCVIAVLSAIVQMKRFL